MNYKKCTALLLVLCLLTMLTGCNRANSARNAVERFETAMNENNFREAFAYIADYDGFGFKSDTEEIINAVASSLDIDIISESVGAAGGTIEVDITTVDLRKVYSNAAAVVIPKYYQTAVSGTPIAPEHIGVQLVNEVVSQIYSGTAPTVTTRCNLQMVTNKNNKWEIRLDNASYSAITGYLDEANNMITTGTITDSLANALGIEAKPAQPAEPVSPSDQPTSEAAGQ
ncbi:MAG: hypothetical protein E7559_08090 [Ruminococcaceae bacterium]|nr:hypothetical protein [Oscillospiraceae bacterium]